MVLTRRRSAKNPMKEIEIHTFTLQKMQKDDCKKSKALVRVSKVAHAILLCKNDELNPKLLTEALPGKNSRR